MSMPRAKGPTASTRHPAAAREAREGYVPVAQPTEKPKRAVPRAFADDPNRKPEGGTSFFKMKTVPRADTGYEMRAYVATPCFAGKSMAVFREGDLEAFVDAARAFSDRRADMAALQGGAFTEEGNLLQVLVGVHIYRPGNNPGLAAARIVVASSHSDDLLTVTLQSAPILIGQFADQMAAVADGARDTALLVGQ